MELVELVKEPIVGDSPAGIDARYEPEYDELQLEIDKLSSATAGGVIDWGNVVRLGTIILKDKSKDIKVAAYLAVGLCKGNGITGLVDGTQILADLVATYWDNMFPTKKRMRGRFGAISWWSERIEKCLKEYEGEDLPSEIVVSLIERLKYLDTELSEKAENAPLLRSLIDLSSRLPVAVESEPIVLPDDDSPVSDLEVPEIINTPNISPNHKPDHINTSAKNFTGTIQTIDDCQNALKDGCSKLSSVADYQLTNDPRNHNSYRYRRLAAWRNIVSIPPSENNQTMIPAPDNSIKESINNLVVNSKFSVAIKEIEFRVGEFLFWLDLSYFSATILASQGSEYLAAKEAVEMEVSFFVKRFPGIQKLSFIDGTPFADTKTRDWLTSLSNQACNDTVQDIIVDDFVSDIISKIKELQKNKKLNEAVDLLQNSIATSNSARTDFFFQIELVNLFMANNLPKLAVVHLSSMLNDIENYSLEIWEPDLALKAYTLAYKFLLLEGNSLVKYQVDDILNKICRIWPSWAMKLSDT
ncbi:MAG: type VI secretion system protein TssA [Desulfotalea sp.]